jgi:hypothetical protein
LNHFTRPVAIVTAVPAAHADSRRSIADRAGN